jgi:hypothetical protein
LSANGATGWYYLNDTALFFTGITLIVFLMQILRGCCRLLQARRRRSQEPGIFFNYLCLPRILLWKYLLQACIDTGTI